jgi:hypothetical protein
MPNIPGLLSIFEEARTLVLRAENDFSWSSWEDAEAAVREIDGILTRLRAGELTPNADIVFAPTGPMQELSLISGWGGEFLELSGRFDEALSSCTCLAEPPNDLALERDLGMDSRYGEVSVLLCPSCGRQWLRYFHENAAFSKSGQWYLGTIDQARAEKLAPEEAKPFLESLDWYYFGGSYFDGQTGKSRGPIPL